jgi:acetyl esterase/lipase
MLRALGLLGALTSMACRPVSPPPPEPIPEPMSTPVTWTQIEAQRPPPADHRLVYESEPFQFGELRLPQGPGPHPVVVLIHGGCWRSAYDLMHLGGAAEALTQAGFATWTPEYRRLGNPGGGWPGTLQDVARATDFLRTLKGRFPLDLDRVVLMGHSAGGQLALWLPTRASLPADSPLFSVEPLPVRGVVALAAISDLERYAEGAGSCNAAVPELLGGSAAQWPERYAQASPLLRLPLGVPVRLVHGSEDPIVPLAQSTRFAEAAQARGEDAQVREVPGAGHFDVIAPFAPAWEAVVQAVRELMP